jgi:hypothetical protein
MHIVHLITVIKSPVLCTFVKILYKNLICMVLKYGHDTCKLSNKTEGMANFIKWKNLRQIYRVIQEESALLWEMIV